MIFATDIESFSFFSDRGLKNLYFCDEFIKHKYDPTDYDQLVYYRVTSVWIKRTKAIAHLLSLGYTVLQSDSDASWIHNPLPLLEKLSKGNDVLFSRGNLEGENPSHGLGICMGFAYYLPTENTKKLLKELMIVMKTDFWPDQGAINSVIFKNIIIIHALFLTIFLYITF